MKRKQHCLAFVLAIPMCVSNLGCSTLAKLIVTQIRNQHAGSWENQTLKAQYEAEFAKRDLDPIEGFWRLENEYVEGVAVIYRVEPSKNLGFAYATRLLEERRKQYLPYPMWGDRIAGRLKAGLEAHVYHGEGLMMRGRREFWEDVTVKFLDPTTIESTIHTSGPVLGGTTQRAYFVGPQAELEKRLAAIKEGKWAKEPPTVAGGSGFLVSRTLVVTNFHVVDGLDNAHCFIDNVPFEAVVLARDRDNDLALLRLASPAQDTIQPLKLGRASKVKRGQKVHALGYPLTDVLGSELRAHTGIVSSLSGYEGRSTQFQVEMSLNPGNSGGPLLDEHGHVVGVVTSKLGIGHMLRTGNVPEGVAFAVKADLIEVLAAAVGASDEIAHAAEGDPMELEAIVDRSANAVVRVEGKE